MLGLGIINKGKRGLEINDSKSVSEVGLLDGQNNEEMMVYSTTSIPWNLETEVLGTNLVELAEIC